MNKLWLSKAETKFMWRIKANKIMSNGFEASYLTDFHGQRKSMKILSLITSSWLITYIVWINLKWSDRNNLSYFDWALIVYHWINNYQITFVSLKSIFCVLFLKVLGFSIFAMNFIIFWIYNVFWFEISINTRKYVTRFNVYLVVIMKNFEDVIHQLTATFNQGMQTMV